MPTLIEEQETTIVMERGVLNARVYSCVPSFQEKMKRLGVSPYKQEGDGCFYKLPCGWVKIRKPRILSPEQKEVARARLYTVLLARKAKIQG